MYEVQYKIRQLEQSAWSPYKRETFIIGSFFSLLFKQKIILLAFVFHIAPHFQ